MKNQVISIPKPCNDIEKYVVYEIKKALLKEGLIVLDLGKDFYYNSIIILMVLLHKHRIVIINDTEKLKVVTKILKIDKLVCIIDSIESFNKDCANMQCEQCEICLSKN